MSTTNQTDCSKAASMTEVTTKFIVCLDTFVTHNHKSNLYASASCRLLMCLALLKIKRQTGKHEDCFIGVRTLVCLCLKERSASSHTLPDHVNRRHTRSNDGLTFSVCAAERKTLKRTNLHFTHAFIIYMTGPAQTHTLTHKGAWNREGSTELLFLSAFFSSSVRANTIYQM